MVIVVVSVRKFSSTTISDRVSDEGSLESDVVGK